MKPKKIGARVSALLLLLITIIPTGIRTYAKAPTAEESGISYGSRLWELFFGENTEREVASEENQKTLLIPGGGVFGARIKLSHVTVSDPCDVRGLCAGDIILKVNGNEVTEARQILDLTEASDGKDVILTVLRGGKELSCTVTPERLGDDYRLGILLRDSAAGIGTITYIDPKTGDFGGLGHGICDTDSGEVAKMTEGEVTGVILGGVQRGEAGKPGELSGILTSKTLGRVYSNTECGVFGNLSNIPEGCEAVNIATRGEVRTGKASIVSTVKNGLCKSYSIEITEIDRSSNGSKSFKIKVTDPTLIALTGGIVRGMGVCYNRDNTVNYSNKTRCYGVFARFSLTS